MAKTTKRSKMKTLSFSVEASSVLLQCEREILTQGPAAFGLAFGCAEIRRHLHAIGTIALRLRDKELISHLVDMCVLKGETE